MWKKLKTKWKEKLDIREYSIMERAKQINQDNCELEGPYECGFCAGHMMLDATYLDQVTQVVTCPYCSELLNIPDYQE